MLCKPLLFLTYCFSSSANVKEVGNGNVLQWIVMVCIKRVIVLIEFMLIILTRRNAFVVQRKIVFKEPPVDNGLRHWRKMCFMYRGMLLSVERGTETGNGERGSGNGERETANRVQGTGNREQVTGKRRTGSGERGKGNGERAQGKKTWKMGTKQRIRKEVAERARVQVRFCSHF